MITATVAADTYANLNALNVGINAYALTVTPLVGVGIPTVTQLNTLATKTTGGVTATVAPDTLANLLTLTGTNNTYAITVTPPAANAPALTAADIVAVDNLTKGVVSATFSDTVANLAALTGTTNAYTINVTDAASMAQLAAIDAKTTGVVTATTVQDNALALANNAGGYIANAVKVVVLDTPTVAQLNLINGNTTGVVKASISGTAGVLVGLTQGVTTNDYTITVTDAPTVAQLNTLNALTTGVVKATITGTSAVLGALTAGSNDYTITSTDVSNATAPGTGIAEINAMNAATTGVVTALSLIHI